MNYFMDMYFLGCLPLRFVAARPHLAASAHRSPPVAPFGSLGRALVGRHDVQVLVPVLRTVPLVRHSLQRLASPSWQVLDMPKS